MFRKYWIENNFLYKVAQPAWAVEYTDCITADG